MSYLGRAARRPSRRLALLLLVAGASFAAAAFFGIQYATAGSSSAPSPTASGAGDGAEAVEVVSAGRKLKSTTIYSDNSLAAVGSGFQPMHAPITIKCPGNNTCTYEAEVWGQVRSSTNDNNIAFCTQVDGNYMDEPLCPFVDPLDADGFFHTRASSQSKTGFSPGNHSVQTDIFSNSGIDDSITKITYRVYTP